WGGRPCARADAVRLCWPLVVGGLPRRSIRGPQLERGHAPLGEPRLAGDQPRPRCPAVRLPTPARPEAGVPIVPHGEIELVPVHQVEEGTARGGHLPRPHPLRRDLLVLRRDRKSTRLNSSHVKISYAVF